MSSDTIPNRSNWNFYGKEPILTDKKKLIDQYIRYMLIRTQRMFEWKNLPDTIPQREIELITQVMRFTIWKRVEGQLYVFFGGLGGIPNEYYQPTTAIISNPYLKYFDVCDINDDCVVMWNDSLHIGLMPMNEKYASMLAECDISLRMASINSRIPALISANTDNTKASAEKVLKDIEDGKTIGVILGSIMMEEGAIKSYDYTNKSASTIKDLIELKQYYKSEWFNDLGIQSNFNMKRESLNSEEVGLNEDTLLPLIDDMLNQRKIAVEKINQMFGTNIEVELSSAWKKLRDEIKEQEKQMDADNPQEKTEGEPQKDETISND